MDASSDLVLALRFVVVSCHSLGASYRLVAVLRHGSAEGHERSGLGGVYLSEMSLLGSFRDGRVFGPVRRLRTGGPAPVGDGVSMACSPALGLSPRP